ncbi:TPA: hypothetical protein P1J70_001791 [Clostridioides difficile]|uniref:hypothetical protein n=1 Tax=Clostridioides difficile TaxID=1496 RepID=UPI00038CA1E0|nr:hypothetical protein [Clostridioides difficile]EGT4936354.1 hypothetical protein [Clostridioides difficile]EGT5050670.1 hypothetical protein [Clostridioides difficile]EGT5525353.1 hypothetical protein [Clostridioides difficile]EGT5560715.1 hypothetical protein [Clostridioides difficile]EGT5564755.1 hypothetical protein [Clostridioides difficile]
MAKAVAKEQLFYRAKDVAKFLDICEATAYKIIAELNEELEKEGFKTFSGRVSVAYFKERYCYKPRKGVI